MTSIGHVLVGFKSLSDRDRSRPWDANLPCAAGTYIGLYPDITFIGVPTQTVSSCIFENEIVGAHLSAYMRLRLLSGTVRAARYVGS